MDANSHVDKSEVLQAMTRAGWTNVASGLGDTFRTGYTETCGPDTWEWTVESEEQFGYVQATNGTEVHDEQIQNIQPKRIHNSFAETGYVKREK